MAFCPNCGAQQPDGTPACTKCNTPMAGGGAAPGAKFKGTIMMGGTSAADVDAMVQKAKAAAATGGRPVAPTPSKPAPQPASAAPAPAAAGAAPPADDALAYQATIMGPITSPTGGGPAEFPHPLFGGGGDAPDAGAQAGDEDPIHSAPTMGFEPSGEGGPTIVDGGAPQSMGEFTDERSSMPVKSGKGGLILVLIIVGVLVLAGIGIGAFLYFRSPAVPQYPGYPMPGQVMPGQVPGQIPGQIPGYPMPGQMPMPGQVPGVPPTAPPAQ